MAGCCEQCNEPMNSIKGRVFLDQPSKYVLLKKDSDKEQLHIMCILCAEILDMCCVLYSVFRQYVLLGFANQNSSHILQKTWEIYCF